MNNGNSLLNITKFCPLFAEDLQKITETNYFKTTIVE